MNKSTKKEIKDLEQLKKRALQKNDLVEAAKICNFLGEILSKNDLYEDAIAEHKEEISHCKEVDDIIGVAVGHRRVGECFCALEKFEDALYHEKLHLKLSQQTKCLQEQQRALATIGRTHFVYTDYLESKHEVTQNFKKAEQAYLKSLDICDELRGENISEKEILEMRARLYLNLGLVYDGKEEYIEALRYVHKALIISREEKLNDNVYRCQFTLSGMYLKANNPEKALVAARNAVSVAKEMNDKTCEIESHVQLAQVFLQLNDIKTSFLTLRNVYKICSKKRVPLDNIIDLLKTVINGMKLREKFENCEDKQETLILCEKLGDWYSEVKLPNQALECYLRQLEFSKLQGIEGKALAPLYVSIAMTYIDLHDYEKALDYYEKELNVRKGDFEEKSVTYCEIAKLLDQLNSPFANVKEIYMKAIQCAEGSKNSRALIKVYQNWLDYIRFQGDVELERNVESKLKHLKEELLTTTDSMEDSSEENVVMEDNSSQLNDDELQMLLSDDEEDDLEELHLAETSSRRKKKKEVNKVNERGETPLHVAAIKGESERVKFLLQQGANVNSRDYCGWQPLHEAANHGYDDIAQLLIENGANVNDPGGQHCGGMTPLHDACQNGHLAVVKLLVNNGADINIKSKDGKTALDLVQSAIQAQLEEYSKTSTSSKLMEQRKKVESFIKSINSKPIHRPSENRNNALELSFQFSDSEEDQLPRKRTKISDKTSPLSPCMVLNRDKDRVSDKDFEENMLDILNGNEMSDSDEGMDQELPFEHLDIDEIENDAFTSTMIEKRTITPSNVKNKTQSIKNINKNQNNNKTKTSKIITSKNKTQYVQSRINYLRTPSPAFVEENDDVPYDEFIIDDVSKKKKSQQSKIDFQKIPSSSKISKPKKRKHSETQCLWNNNSIDNTDSFNNSDVAIIDAPSCINTSNTPQTNNNNIFRIKVRINDQLLLIPCTQSRSLQIGWLIEQIKQRYLKISGLSLHIALHTKDNALLNVDDVIGDVIMNNEELIAESLGADFPSFTSRYKDACTKYEISPLEGITSTVHNTNCIELNNVLMKMMSLTALMESITFNDRLCVITISNCFMGDAMIKMVSQNIALLPNLHTLVLSCVGMTTEGLSILSNEFIKPITTHHRNLLKVEPFSNLVSVDFSYNDFSNDNLLVTSLIRIMKRASQLKRLNLKSCDINMTCFDQSCFMEQLKESMITSLDVSANNINCQNAFDNLVTMVTKMKLSSWSFSECQFSKEITITPKIFSGSNLTELCLDNIDIQIVDSLFTNMPSSEMNVSQLSLKNLRMLTRPKPDIILCGMSTCCESEEVMRRLCRRFGDMSSLTSLDLSYNSSMDIVSLATLLKNIQNSSSNLEKLLLHGCTFKDKNETLLDNFCSVCETLRTSKTMKLCFIDMSFSLFEFNVDELIEAWRIYVSPSLARTEILRQHLCSFSKFLLYK